MKYCLLVCLLLSTTFPSLAKEVKLFKDFGVNNPMSYLFVRSFAQDKHDFMWFGTQEGLHRFDGYKLQSFHHDAALADSLSSNVVSRILIDNNQRLWVGTRGGGLNLYRETEQNFFHINTKSKALALTNDTVNALVEDSTGKIWVGTEKGLNILSYHNGKWLIKHIYQELGNNKSLSHNTIHSIIESDHQQIWVGTNGGGISVFDLQGNFIKTVKYGDNNTSLYANKFTNALYQDKQGNLWIGTVDSGLIKYNINSGDFNQYRFDELDNNSIASDTIEAIYQDSQQRIWIATDKGLLIYNEREDNFNRYNHSPNNPFSLSNDFILTFFEDNNQMMWIGTFTGVNRWDPKTTTFSQFNRQANPELTNHNITSFTESVDNRLFFSSYSGGIYQLFQHDQSISRVDFKDYFSELRIMSLFADNNTLWVGTRTMGLFEVDLLSKEIKKYQHDDSDDGSISANSITDIVKDHQGNIWVSTFHQGINRLEQDGNFSHFTKQETKSEQGPSSNHVLQLLVDQQGVLWLATYGGGLNRFDTQSETFVHLRHNEQDASSISSDVAWVMLQDSEQNLWVGTQAAGLNVLSHKNMQAGNYAFTYLDSKDGMKSRTVYGIEQDLYGDIWFSSNKGISRYSLAQKKFKHFDLSHGLIDLEYNHGAVFKSIDNRLYFGAGKGITSIDPEEVNINKVAPKVRLTNVLNLNEPMVFDVALADLTHLSLDYKDQLISFEYVGLNYASPESTRYKYRLLGFDQEWIDAGKSRRATYTNLPSGSYTLQIIAGNSDNLWSEPGLSLDITVKSAPWNTWWAYLLYVIALALSLLMYARFLNKKLLAEQKLKQQLKKQVQEKTQEFQLKNVELEQANKLLEKAAIIDKLTGVKSRRYLDIYIEQTSQLMNQIHNNSLLVQRNTLPRLYVLMVQMSQLDDISNSQLVNLADLLLYSRNSDDLVIRWSEDTFAVIGYEKDNNAGELAARLTKRFAKIFDAKVAMNTAYCFYPFNRDKPLEVSWDQVSVMVELALKQVSEDESISWLGLCEAKTQPFSYLQLIQEANLTSLKQHVIVKQG